MQRVIDTGIVCYQTMPCMHDVKVDGVKQGRWDGIRIYQWYKDNEQEAPAHFAEQKKVLDQYENELKKLERSAK